VPRPARPATRPGRPAQTGPRTGVYRAAIQGLPPSRPASQAGEPGPRLDGPVHGPAEPVPTPVGPAPTPVGPDSWPAAPACSPVVVASRPAAPLMLLLFVRRGVYEIFSSMRKTLVIQKSAYSGVFSLFGSKVDGNLFRLFWVICMVRFSCIWMDACVFNQVYGVEDQRAPRSS
jgi:hypothetical protein